MRTCLSHSGELSPLSATRWLQIGSLRLKGLDNGRLYRDVAQGYDLCFSKDRLFVQGVRAIDRPGTVKVLRVSITQAPGGRFTRAFLEAVQATDWSQFPNGSDWPA